MRARGERNVLTLCFLSELPKLIISSGLTELCQEQEPRAKPQLSQALPAPSVTSAPHPYLLLLNPPLTAPLRGRTGAATCRAGPGRAWHAASAFACSGVLIKSFIVLHSRKKGRRRNGEQDRVEWIGREEGKPEKKRGEKSDGRVGERNGICLFSLLLSPFHFLLVKRCLI